jgi:hypothetical protein
MAYQTADVGLQANPANQKGINPGGDRFGAALVSQAHARYAGLMLAGRLFTAHNVAAQAVSVALATTYTGLVVSNPLGNTKIAVLLGYGYALSVAPAGIASLHLLRGYSSVADITHTTPLAAPGIQNSLIGATEVSSMKADSAATISTPTYGLPLMGGFTAAALPASPMVWCDLAGAGGIKPGGFAALGALTAVTGFGAFAWYEVDA